MKTQILFALGAVAALAATANAQTVPNNNDGVPLRDIPNIGPLFHAPIQLNGEEFVPPQWTGELPIPLDKLPLDVQLMFDPKLPAYPKLNTAQAAGTKIRVLQTYRGEIFQAEIVRQSTFDVLATITSVMGINAVIDPVLKNSRYSLAVVRAATWEDLLKIGGAEMWKSSAGTYFFAAVPNRAIEKLMQDLDEQGKKYQLEREKLLNDPRYDPFVYPNGGLNPKDYFGRSVEPQPNWQKREFNGHEFYYIPGLPQSDLAK